MAKKIIFLWVLIVLCTFSIFAFDADYWRTVVEWIFEEAGDELDVDGCTFAPDGIRYYGKYISLSSVCDAHDRDYNNKVNREVADKKLKDGVYNTLRTNGVNVVTALAVSNLYYAGVRNFGWLRY